MPGAKPSPARATLADLDRLPALCSLDDVARVYGISRSAAYRREQAGEFDRLQLRPAYGRLRYSGALIRKYAEGEDLRGAARPKLRQSA